MPSDCILYANTGISRLNGVYSAVSGTAAATVGQVCILHCAFGTGLALQKEMGTIDTFPAAAKENPVGALGE